MTARVANGDCIAIHNALQARRLPSFAKLPGLPHRSRLERTQDVLPESFQVVPQQRQAIEVNAVELLAPTSFRTQQPRLFQHSEMLRDGWPADRKVARDVVDRARSAPDGFHDRAPRRIGERLQDLCDVHYS